MAYEFLRHQSDRTLLKHGFTDPTNLSNCPKPEFSFLLSDKPSLGAVFFLQQVAFTFGSFSPSFFCSSRK